MIKGYWGDHWAPVVDAFAKNFVDAGEQGAGFALYHRGDLVVNVWAGHYANRLAKIVDEPWSEQTCVNIFSVGKSVVALCILRLVEKGCLDLDRPIAEYWPEFVQTSNDKTAKGKITIRQVLCHRSGLSAFHSVLMFEDIFNWDVIIAAVAAESPWWEPNTAQGYSPFIYGWLLGELVKRVSGSASFDDYFQREIAKPLGIGCYFGVPDTLLSTIADVGPLQRTLPTGNSTSAGADSVSLGALMKADVRGVTSRAFSNPISLMTASNSQKWRQTQIPAANAHANATALATIFGKLANGGGDVLAASHLPLCWQEQSFAEDRVLGLPLRFSHGFMLSQHNRPDCRYGRGAQAFGHPGAGGSLGFADPNYQLGFGYVTSRLGQSLFIDTRATNLIDVVYKVLEES